jgi:hypothetical protein
MPPTSRERVRSSTVSKTRCIVECLLSRVLSRLSLVRVTVGYAAMLVVVATTLLILGPRVEDAVVSARGMARLRHLQSNETTPLYRHGCGDVAGRLGAALAAL